MKTLLIVQAEKLDLELKSSRQREIWNVGDAKGATQVTQACNEMSALAQGVHVGAAPAAAKDSPMLHPPNALLHSSAVMPMDAVKFPLMSSWKAGVVLLDGRKALGQRNVRLVAQQVVMSQERRWKLAINGCVIERTRPTLLICGDV